MKFRVEVVCLNDGGEQRCSVMEMERAELAMETLGLSLAEGKTMLHGVQDFVASQQALEDLKRRCDCPACGQRYHSKTAGTHTVKTVFGVGETTNHETVREHLQAVAERMEGELGEERKLHEFAPPDGEVDQPLPDGPMTVGIDGG